MYWLILVISLFPLLGFIILGIFMLYSAVSGRGMAAPEPEAPFVVHLRYKLRGLIGFVFTCAATYSLYKMIILGLADLR